MKHQNGVILLRVQFAEGFIGEGDGTKSPPIVQYEAGFGLFTIGEKFTSYFHCILKGHPRRDGRVYSLHVLQSLIDIRQDIIDVFKPYGQTNQIRCDTARRLLFLGEL